MRSLSKRLTILEDGKRESLIHDFSGFTDEQLDQMEAIALKIHNGEPIEQLPDDELALLVSVPLVAA